jgi:hypothetical protein
MLEGLCRPQKTTARGKYQCENSHPMDCETIRRAMEDVRAVGSQIERGRMGRNLILDYHSHMRSFRVGYQSNDTRSLGLNES